MSITAIGSRRRSTGKGPIPAQQVLVALLLAGIAAVLTWYVTGHGGHSFLLGVAAVIVIAGSVWFALTSQVGLALVLLMVYLGALDGYLKLSTGSSLVTFVRDVLLWSLVVGELVRASVRHTRLSMPPLGAWVVWFAIFLLVQLLNPQDGSLLHSAAGLRQSLEFIPLFFLTYVYVRTTKALRVFLAVLTVVAVLNAVADIIQFHETPQQLAAWGPGYNQRVLGSGTFQYAGRDFYDPSGQVRTRPFGLMSDEGAGGLVDAFALAGIVALAALARRRQGYLVLLVLAAGIATAGLASSQGRASVVCGVVVMLTFGVLAVTARGRTTAVAGIAALAAIAYLASGNVLSGNPSRYAGLTTSQILQTTSQARGYSIGQIPKNLARYPFGAGLGSGGPAVGQSGAPAAAGVADSETEFSFATLEAGIPGMLILVGFTVFLLVIGLQRCRREPDPEARILLAAIIAPIGGMLAVYWVGPITPTTPAGPYLWAAGGIVSYWLLKRPRDLWREAQRTKDEVPAMPPVASRSALNSSIASR